MVQAERRRAGEESRRDVGEEREEDKVDHESPRVRGAEEHQVQHAAARADPAESLKSRSEQTEGA